ncbi:MAG: hypothetical protein ABSF45_04570 [Terriglobia bacterium]|jgi:hypothetical protein
MKLDRREFITLVGASVASSSTPLFSDVGGNLDAPAILERNGWRLQVTPTGEIASFTDGKLELVNHRLGDNRPRLVVGGNRQYHCDRPSAARREGAALIFQYDFAGQENFSVHYEVELQDLAPGVVTLKQKLGIHAAPKIDATVELTLPRNIQLPFENRKVFLPLKNGIGRQKTIQGFESENEYVYPMAGGTRPMGKPQLLAIPMVDEYADATGWRLTHSADPYFATYFFLAHGEKTGRFNCTYPAQVGVEKEERVVYTGLHRGDEKTAMQVFYATSVADVKPGPDWLHDVAMVDYDYLSKNGQGWFRDIDALESRVAPEDRGKVFLALHGWYDYVGRYAFDWRKGVFDKEWTAFPSARTPRVQAFANIPPPEGGIGWPADSIKAMRPVPTSIADMHRRIRYAKDKGFKVGIYYADGTNACEGLKDIYDSSKVLRWGGWEGPDTEGKAYAQNPLHPEVREFYLRYIQALLEEFGKEADGFIWDETFVVRNDNTPSAIPGYPTRAMMTLVKEVTAKVAEFSPQLAFLASDDIGAWSVYDLGAPYCLVAHGTYQDSACTPAGWSYGLFPNYRNVIWSCNWSPLTRFEYSRYAVEAFRVPVPISNGAFGDDMGFGDMKVDQQRKILDLFDKCKRTRMDIGWITEEPWQPTYQGREVEFKWSL